MDDDEVAIKFTRTPVYRAIRKQDLAALHRAIRRQQFTSTPRCSSPDPQRDPGRSLSVIHSRDRQTGFTYVHLVVVIAEADTEPRLVPFIYALSNAGANIDTLDERYRTAVYLAIVKRLPLLMEALLRTGAQQTREYRALIAEQPQPHRRRLSETYDKFSPGLWTAVAERDVGTVFILLNSWCRVRISRDQESSADQDEHRGNQQTLLEYAREVGAGRDLVRLLEGYEMSLELVHSTLAGDRHRMLDLLTNSSCDSDVRDISYQDSFEDNNENIRLRPRSLREAAEDMGHWNVLDLLPEEASNERLTQLQKRRDHRRDSGNRGIVDWLSANIPLDQLTVRDDEEAFTSKKSHEAVADSNDDDRQAAYIYSVVPKRRSASRGRADNANGQLHEVKLQIAENRRSAPVGSAFYESLEQSADLDGALTATTGEDQAQFGKLPPFVKYATFDGAPMEKSNYVGNDLTGSSWWYGDAKMADESTKQTRKSKKASIPRKMRSTACVVS